MPACNKLVRIHCKAGSVSARLVFETRAKCQEFVAQYKDDGFPHEINSPFCYAKTTITVHQSKQLEDREIGQQHAPLWRVLAEQLKILFPDGDDEAAFIIPALDARSHVLSIKDRRNGVGKPVFKLASLGSGQLFTLVSPDSVCSWCFSDGSVATCSLSSHQASGVTLRIARPMCDGRLFAFSPFSPPGESRRPFLQLPSPVGSTFCGLAKSCPGETLSCLFLTALWLQNIQSIVVLEAQSTKDIDLTCFKTFPIKTTTCLQVGPMSSIIPDLRSVLRFPATISDEALFQLLHVPVGNRILLKHHRKYYSALQGGMDVAPSFPEVCGVLLGTPGVSLDLFFPNRRTESSGSGVSKSSFDTNNILCHQELHGKDEYLQAIQVLALRFRFWYFFP